MVCSPGLAAMRESNDCAYVSVTNGLLEHGLGRYSSRNGLNDGVSGKRDIYARSLIKFENMP